MKLKKIFEAVGTPSTSVKRKNPFQLSSGSERAAIVKPLEEDLSWGKMDLVVDVLSSFKYQGHVNTAVRQFLDSGIDLCSSHSRDRQAVGLPETRASERAG